MTTNGTQTNGRTHHHDRSYDVVATSFPIVYNRDGDHDPNGMLYTLRCYVPLLDWVRAQWEDHEELLPALHRRAQLIQLVVDGLGRYAQMRELLAAGHEADRDLLADLGGETCSRDLEEPRRCSQGTLLFEQLIVGQG